MRTRSLLTLALFSSLSLFSCGGGGGTSTSQAQSMAVVADALRTLANAQVATTSVLATSPPVIEEIPLDNGSRMVILAFGNGDFQSWLLGGDGTVTGAGYQRGKESYQLVPNGHITTH